MLGLVVERTAKLSFTADDWQLYTSSFSEEEIKDVAHAINKGVAEAIESGNDKGDATNKAIQVLRKYSKYGATDSEPIAFLGSVMDVVFGE